MILKERCEDFYVKEIFNIEDFRTKKEKKNYHYVILKKRNYNTIRAINYLSKLLKIRVKDIHYAGTKDKRAVTEQVLSLNNIGRERLFKSIEYINEKIKDLELKYLGAFPGRINLGDLKGNCFEIIVRNISYDKVLNNIVETDKILIDEIIENLYIELNNKIKRITKKGVLNKFDSQRFGYANNSHLIGLYLIRNEPDKAINEIFSSLPSNPSEELVNFVNIFSRFYEKKDFEQLLGRLPKCLEEYRVILEHLKKYQNDYLGAIRKLPKKLRTLYVNALQSYIWNKSAELIDKNNGFINLEVPLVGYETDLNKFIYKDILKQELNKFSLRVGDFEMKHMPELSSKGCCRVLRIFPEKLKIIYIKEDEIYKGKFKVKLSFILPPGSYATLVVKDLFN